MSLSSFDRPSNSRRQGRINEEIFALVKKTCPPRVMKAIARIESVLPNAYRGDFGPEVTRKLEMLEKGTRFPVAVAVSRSQIFPAKFGLLNSSRQFINTH